ncbi:MAG: long-chain fatty acid--CoA ligase [Bacteroidales bacterium]
MDELRIFDLLKRYASCYSHKTDVLAVKRNETWKTFNTDDYIKMSNLISIGLLRKGFVKGDKIITVSNNRPEWNFLDMGMMQAGIVHVPVYPTISDEEYEFIIQHCEAKMIVVSDKELYLRIKPMAYASATVQDILTFDNVDNAPNWTILLNYAHSVDFNENYAKLEEIKASISPDDMATIIYTSGTTGMPKGVMLSHRNFMYQVEQIKKFIPINQNHKILSFLPLCHVLERIGGYVFQYMGISIYYAESIEKIADNIREIKPDGFITVPRLLERVYDKIMARGKDLGTISKNIFFWAVNLALQYDERGNGSFYRLKQKIADFLIFKKWRQALGGNIKIIISGGAALQPRIARVFWAAGLPVQEGYGLTETAPVICVNHDKYPELRIGTVGPLIGEEQELKIAGDGEILFRGPNLMIGYFKDEEKTKEAIDSDGWFHTGDIGEIAEGKFLKITDRKKEIFKLSTGKYVAPQPIENLLKESLFIDQVMVVGENQKFTGALISPDFEFLHKWCFNKKIHFRENRDLIEMPEVIARYQLEIDKFNEKLGKTEQIKVFALVCEEWTVQTGELSPTLKLHRKFIEKKFIHRIKQIFPE